MKPRVSLTMIVKDEAANLRACVESCAGLFNELVIVDTGSTDDTKAIAWSLGAKVFDFAWCDDFSAARNESLRHATEDWIFWMDADDRLDDENHERALPLFASLKSPTAYGMLCASKMPNGEMSLATPTLRLFHHSLGMTWRYRVHEELFPFRDDATRMTDVRILHLGYADKLHALQKSDRNLRLIKMSILEGQGRGQMYHYIGATWLERGEPAHAAAWFEACKKSLNERLQYPGYYGRLVLDLGICYGQLRQWDKLKAIEDEAIAAQTPGGRLLVDSLRRSFPLSMRAETLNAIKSATASGGP